MWHDWSVFFYDESGPINWTWLVLYKFQSPNKVRKKETGPSNSKYKIPFSRSEKNPIAP